MDYVITGDGSNTLFNKQIGEHYHSKHGALQEAKHVFLNLGLKFYLERNPNKEVSILEIGFGTGLNFILAADYCTANAVKLSYCGIEAFPLDSSVIKNIGYNSFVSKELWCHFNDSYSKALCNWVAVNTLVDLKIAHQKVLTFETDYHYDIIYFDAFAAVHQPEMWTDETLAHVTKFLKTGGVFVTYAITGNLKRSMKALGFAIEKAPGAPGKREMLRAIKL